MNNHNGKGLTLWFTGLPCSGKTTVAEIVAETLRTNGNKIELLDGDEIRKHFSAGVGFSREDRNTHLRRVAYLCHLLTKHGVIVLASFVSPYRENRDYARGLINNFVEIYAKCSLEICIQRDVKGMYKKALNGKIQQFTGVSDPYEEPTNPELVLETDKETAQENALKVIEKMKKLGYLTQELAEII